MFKLDDYETVAMLNKWFVDNYPMGRTNIEILHHDPEKGYITCRAEVYRDSTDVHPATTNIAHGVRDLYNSNMRRFYAEDIASSALGRAITLLKGGQTATRDDMEKVAPKSFEKRLEEKITVEREDDPWTTKTVVEAPQATMSVEEVAATLGAKILTDDPKCKHGNRIWKTGVSKSNKPWGHWACDNRPMNGERWADMEKCDPIWYDIQKDGIWGERVERR
jgi:hypothetical protein